MYEYNFDPMTGEPIKKESETSAAAPQQPEEAPIQGAPTAEQPIYHFIPEQQPAEQQPAAEQPPIYEAPHRQAEPPKKEKRSGKPVTIGLFIPVVAGVAVLALLLGLAGGFFGAALFEEEALPSGSAVIYKTTKLTDEKGNAVKGALSVAEVAALVKNSVVEITTEQIVTGSFMQQYVSEGAGSGVIITEDGYIVTNHHVIEGATNVKVRLADGAEHTARYIGTDAKSDLAIIKIEAEDLTPAAFGSSKELKVGETVVAVGNPLGELGGTVTQGIISALDREMTIENTTMRLLQTDTAINPGNSGGGMFNTSGQLVGIVNAKNAGAEIEGLGFAIPIDTAAKVIEDLLSHGYVTGRVETGLDFQEINDSMTAMMYRVNELGLYISSVKEGSSAEKAGFLSGDYVVSVDGTLVTTEAEANSILDQKAVGDTVEFAIKRNGQQQKLSLTLSEYVPSKEDEKEQEESKPILDNFFDAFGF